MSETTVERLLEGGVRVMWVAAHPDDECFVGAVLAKAALGCGCPVHFVVLTEGEGGGDRRAVKTPEPLGEVRAAELRKVAALYRATLRQERFFNAPLPMSSFPKRDALARRWAEAKDPAMVVAEEIRAFRPDLLLTFAPVHGATGHPEHELASRFAMAGVRLAADPAAALAGEPYRVANVAFLLHRYWWLVPLGMRMDPFRATEELDGRQRVPDGRTCLEVMAANTLPHETQSADMGMMRAVSKLMRRVALRRVDPFTEMWDPYES